MKIVLNSDVLYGDYSTHGLPAGVIKLAEVCVAHGHDLVLPLTTLLEVRHRQDEIVGESRKELSDAAAVLRNRGIEVPDFDPNVVVPDVDPVALFQSVIPNVIVERPTLDDYEDAHRRASLHAPPHPPEIKSDEMRDLVIWAIAVRLSSKEGGAILVSKDVVHVNYLGNTESNSVGLVRLQSTVAALDYLEVATPAGDLLWKMIDAWRGVLVENELPLGTAPSLRSIKNVTFVQGVNGPTGASGAVKIAGLDSKLIEADIQITQRNDLLAELELSNIRVAGTPCPNLRFSRPMSPAPLNSHLETKMESIRKILGGTN